MARSWKNVDVDAVDMVGAVYRISCMEWAGKVGVFVTEGLMKSTEAYRVLLFTIHRLSIPLQPIASHPRLQFTNDRSFVERHGNASKILESEQGVPSRATR